MGNKKHDTGKVPDDSGEPWDCARCGQRMQRWKHAPGWKPQPGKAWFLFWYECINPACKTRQVMPRGACVKPGQAPIPVSTRADDLATWEDIARAAVADLRRYADDPGPERRLVSAETYEAAIEGLSAISGEEMQHFAHFREI